MLPTNARFGSLGQAVSKEKISDSKEKQVEEKEVIYLPIVQKEKGETFAVTWHPSSVSFSHFNLLL
jgi:anthranilate/para-aminobenzoate synthase component II